MNYSIDLKYLRGAIPEDELEAITEQFHGQGILFERHDFSGRAQNNLADIVAPIALAISSETCQAYLVGIASNATYELIKKSVLSIWHSISGRKITTVSAGAKVVESDLAMDLDISVDNRTRIKFKLKGDIPDTLKEKCVEDAFQLLRQIDSSKIKESQVAFYQNDPGRWSITEDMNLIRELAQRKKG
jgi:hypothetical protein